MNAPSVTTPPRLSGLRVVVTGGARGIGGEIAARVSSEGARVAILDRLVADWNRMFSINTRAMLTTMQVAVRRMLADEVRGKIINLASMAAKKGGANEGHYAASKAAVVALTRAAALEWGCHGITANSLCPGYILTDMGAATRTEADVATWSTYSPLGRLGQAADVAGVAAFLASSDADYLTGQAINVTGGMVMH